jgi:hypothetical protein
MEANGADEEVVFFQRRSDCAKGFFRELSWRLRKIPRAAGLGTRTSTPSELSL